MFTFRDLKRLLFENANAAVPGYTDITESAFLELLFPDSLLKAVVVWQDKTLYFSNVFLDKAQRNKLINGKYTGYVLSDGIGPLLRENPGVWDEIRSKCNTLLHNADTGIIREIILDFSHSVKNHDLLSVLLDSIESDISFAFAVVLVFLIANGNEDCVCPLFVGSASLLNQFSYMDGAVNHFNQPYHLPEDLEGSPSAVEAAYDNYSKLLWFVTRIQENIGSVVEISFANLFDGLYRSILNEAEERKKLIYISGPAGSEKNAITQLLYLRFANDVKKGVNTTLAPFYINLNRYRQQDLSYDSAIKLLEQELDPFIVFCARQNTRIPLLFVDGIRNYNAGEIEVDYHLNRILHQKMPDVRLVVAAENAAILNRMRQRQAANFAKGKYALNVVIDSLFLGDVVAQDYFKAFSEIQDHPIRFSVLKRLQELHIEKVDTSQLQMLLPYLEDARSISDLYESVSLTYLNGNTSELATAAQWAFDFAYTDHELPNISASMRRLLSSHDSIQEYFIARWYLDKIRSSSEGDNIGTLNMVLPKGVTRFIVPILNESTADESCVLELIKKNYYEMGLLAKSEMTYWLGRIRSAGMAQQAESLLEQYYHEQRLAAKDAWDPNSLEDKHNQFLLRGISVSLIVKGHMDVSQDYLELLIENDLANEINRGFHLEYYGDKAYLPSFNTLDFLDVKSVGRRTLEQLISANEDSIAKNRIPPIFDLNLFTVFSLLQARIEYHTTKLKFDITPYMRRCLNQANWYLRSNRCHSQKVLDYFLMLMRDFAVYLEADPRQRNSIGAKTFTTYSKRVFRTGWVKRNVPEPETVAEHMYNTWLLGMFLLPNSDANKEYSKERILELILIHDLAEAVTGDIERPIKDLDPEFYDQQESSEMAMCLLRGSYPNMPNQSYRYELWQEWPQQNTINGIIAKELDLIQTMYQLLTYYKKWPDCFELADLQRWMRDRYKVRTLIGRSILQQAVLENRDFQEVLEIIASAE